MDRAYLDIILAIALISITIPIGILWSNFNRQPVVLKWLAILLSFSLFFDCANLAVILFELFHPNILPGIYYSFGTILYGIFFYTLVEWKFLKTPLIFLNVVATSFGLANLFFIQGTSMNSYTYTLHTIIVLILSVAYFFKLLMELPAQQLQKFPMFWIVSGIFFSHAGKLAIYAVTHYLIHFVKDNLIIVWSFHNFLTIIGNLVIAYGAWLNHKQLRSTSLSL
jgi:hypothetical protein